MRQLPRNDYLAIKAATRQLVKQAGGLDNAAAVTRPGRSALSDYGNPNHDDVFMPADVIADLETEISEPLLTAALARLQGCELMRVEFGGKVDPKWAEGLAAMGKEISEAFAKAGMALANGGDIDAGEIRTLELIREFDEALGSVARVRALLVARSEGAL